MTTDAFHLNKAANLSKNWGPPLILALVLIYFVPGLATLLLAGK